MRDGLKIVQLPGGYGYSVTRVGWLRRVSGDDYELVNGRTMAREGAYSIDGITKAAAKGPNGYKLSVPDEMPEELHRLLIRRAVPANAKAWAEACPMPKDWSERE